MAVGVTRDHHLLARNLKLNGNYLSNDGEDEGINIADDGDVTMTSNDTQLKLAYDGSNNATLSVDANGATTLATADSDGAVGHLTLAPDGDINLNAIADIHIPVDVGLILGDGAEKIESDNTNLTISSDGDIILDATANDIIFKDAGSEVGRIIWDNVGGDGEKDFTLQASSSAYNDLRLRSLGASADIILDSKTGIIQFKLDGDDDDLCTLTVAANGATTIASVDASGSLGADLTLDVDGDINLDVADGQIYFKNGTAGTSHGYIDVLTSSTLKLRTTTNYDLDLEAAGTGDIILDSGDKIILDSATGLFEMHGAGTTAKFADMYAGMILGYTAINIDATQESYAVTASLAVTDANHKVIFVAPPSGKVEIFVSFSAIAITQRWLKLGLSNNATYAAIEFPNAADPTNEHTIIDLPVDGFARVITHNWVVEGLTAGTEYTWYLGAQAEQAGRMTMWWGGAATGRYAPFIMKATALPATITTE